MVISVSSELMDRARAGLAAWQRGDLTSLADLLDPEVELLSWEPGPWDCRGKEAVLELLAERVSVREAGSDIDVIDAGDEQLVVSRRRIDHSELDPPATLVTFVNGHVVKMEQFRRKTEAMSAVH